ncbi:MAG TPA: hypothetical protein VFB73_03495 [Chloroflexota bacterium]|nr:hypothetical protein [Chloroflexota bacterium]
MAVDAPPTQDPPAITSLVPAVAGVRDGLTAEEVLELLAAVFPAGTPCQHWCAGPAAIGPLAAGRPTDLAGWTEGRVWGARAEVRWCRSAAGDYSVLYLGEGTALPSGFAPLASPLSAARARLALWLWGARGPDGRFSSAQLPRALDYAGIAPAASQVCVPVQLLLAPDGRVCFVRLTLAEEG